MTSLVSCLYITYRSHCRQNVKSTINGIFSSSLWAVTFLPEVVIIGFWNFAWDPIIYKNNNIWGIKQFSDMCNDKLLLMSMGGRVEGLACADPGAMTPIGMSGNFAIFIVWPLSNINNLTVWNTNTISLDEDLICLRKKPNWANKFCYCSLSFK